MTKTSPVRPVAGLVLGLAVLACPLAGVGRGDEKPVTAADLFPLKKGAKWEMAAAINPDERGQVLEVMGTKVVGQDVCYEVANVIEKQRFTTSRWCYSVTKDGIYLRAIGAFGSSKMSSLKDWCVLKNRSPEVQKWTIRQGGEDDGHAFGFQRGKDIPAGAPYDEVLKSQIFEVKCVQYNEAIEHNKQKVEATIVVQVEMSIGYNLLYKKEKALIDTKFLSQPHETRVTTITHYVRGKGIVRDQHYTSDNATGKKVEQDAYQKGHDWVTTKATGLGGAAVGEVIINKNDVESDTPVAVDRYRLEPGDEAEFKFSRTITREIGFTVKNSKGLEGGGGVGLDFGGVKGELSGKIRTAVETVVGEKLKDEETRERKIIVRNTTKNVRKGEIVWVDIYKTGKVEVTQDGEKYEVQFRFPFGTRLESRNKE